MSYGRILKADDIKYILKIESLTLTSSKLNKISTEFNTAEIINFRRHKFGFVN